LITALVLLVAQARGFAFTAGASGSILKDGSPVVLKGFDVTCTEYLLRGIGTQCIAKYDWNNASNVIGQLDTAQMDLIFANLLPAPAGVQPTIRIPLTAAYYLDVSTSAWASNRATYPHLADQCSCLAFSVRSADARIDGRQTALCSTR